MLRVEDVQNVRFDPRGRHIVFERHGPYRAMAKFNRSWVRGALRAKLYVAEVDDQQTPSPLFSQDRKDGYTLGTFSPNGQRISYRRVGDGYLRVGVYDFARRDTVEFEITPDLGYGQADDPIWLSDTRLAYLTTSPGRFHSFYSTLGENVDAVSEQWQNMREGREATASAIGSGRHAMSRPKEKLGGIIIADAATGSSQLCARGDFLYPLMASPDAKKLAVLSFRVAQPHPTLPVEHDTLSMLKKELVIADSSCGTTLRSVCSTCDVLPGAFGWAPDSSALVFYGTESASSWSVARLWRYDLATAVSRPVDLGGVTLNVGKDWQGRVFPKWGWLAGDIVLPASRPAAEISWFRLRPGSPPIDLGFAAKRSDIAGRLEDALLMAVDGEVWSVSPSGRRKLLTESIASPVQVWREPFASIDDGSQTLALTLSKTAQNQRLVFLDPKTGRSQSLRGPTAGNLLTMSKARHAAIFRQDIQNVAVFSLVTKDGLAREWLRINEYLAKVDVGHPLRIDHRGPNGEELNSWILLPSNSQPHKPFPLVTQVYAGFGNHKAWDTWQPWFAHALNPYILAGQGYAVLFPSIPQLYHQIPREPLSELSEVVLSAVDAAVAKRYADPKRLAIQGQSYGGYTALGVIGQTDRFKAAVGISGIYDLLSFYGAHDPATRIDTEVYGPDLFGVSMSETGQGGMGLPPWQDPQRYLRNSPLMFVERIDTPVLLIHGDLDYVPISQAEEMFTALYRLNKDSLFVRYWGESHVFDSPANIADMWERMIAWYDAHLGVSR